MSLGQTASSFAPNSIGGGATSTYASQVMADSPLLYLRLAETSGTTVVDSSGNGRNGVYSGSPTFNISGLVSAETNPCVYFNSATNDYASVASSVWMNVSSMTVSCVTKVSLGNGIKMLVSRYHDPDTDRSWFLYTDNAVFKFYVIAADGSETTVDSGYAAVLATTYFVVAYASATETGIRVYDATGLVASATGIGRTVKSSTRPFIVARSDDGATYQHEAYIDDVVFYGSVLTPVRLDTLANLAVAAHPKYINFVSGELARNGTSTHTVTFPATSAGSFLVAVVSVADVVGVTNLSCTIGWTKRLTQLFSTDTSIFTRTANAGETTLQLTYDLSNHLAQYAVYEFPSGTRWHSGLTANATMPTLSNLPGTTATVMSAISYRLDPGNGPTYVIWTHPFGKDFGAMSDTSAGDGVYLTTSHRDFYTGTSSTPAFGIQNPGPTQTAVWALIVP